MMNPYTCLKNIDSIINGYKSSKIYKFIHLPVQSGDNLILEKMNRKYKVEDFQKIIDKFRFNFPEITISTDVIVGFPTESEVSIFFPSGLKTILEAFPNGIVLSS